MDNEWEERCCRCARCCYEKLDIDGEIVYTHQPCEHLDVDKKRCRIYLRRHQIREGCVPINQEVIDAGILPADCPYVLHNGAGRGVKKGE